MKVIDLEKIKAKEEPFGLRKEPLSPPDTERITFGWGICRPKAKVEEHWHEGTEEVLYVISGRAILRINEKEIEMKPGLIVYVPPGAHHVLDNPYDEEVQMIYARAAIHAGA